MNFHYISEASLGCRREAPRQTMERLDRSGMPIFETAEPAVSGLKGLVAGKALTDKKSQKTQVKQEQTLCNLALDPGKPQINSERERELGVAMDEVKRKR